MSVAPKVGKTTDARELAGRRDVFHVPGVLVYSHTAVLPGDPVRFTDDKMDCVYHCDVDDKHAVVDPFLNSGGANPVELFWVFLIPDLVTNLTHHFDLDPSLTANIQDMTEDDDDSDDCVGCYEPTTGRRK